MLRVRSSMTWRNVLRSKRPVWKKLEQERAELTAEIFKICVQRRNQYCKDTIRADFAAGIREHDEEAELDDDQASDSSTELRDYDEFARNLPVFITSSKAFQQMSSTKRQLQTEAPGFSSLEDTEIPAVQAHAKTMSNAARSIKSKEFLNEFDTLIGTIHLFLNSGNAEALDPSQNWAREKNCDVEALDTELANLARLFNQDFHDFKKKN